MLSLLGAAPARAAEPPAAPVEPDPSTPARPDVAPDPAPAPAEAPPPISGASSQALQPGQADETIPEPLEPEPAAPAPMRCRDSRRCRGMTIAGIVTSTLGLAALGTGIGLLVAPDSPIPDEPAYVTSTRPAGLVSVTIGAGVTLTAALMLVAARQAYRRVEPRRSAWHIDGKGLHF